MTPIRMLTAPEAAPPATGVRRFRWLLVLAAISAALFLVACDDDGDADGTATATEESETATASATEGTDGTATATGTAEAAGQYGLAPAGSPTPGATEAAAGGDAQQLALQANIGTEASQGEIDEWDIDITPDGTGLPDAEGAVSAGADVYQVNCARCHGPDGMGTDLAPQLVLGEDMEPGPWEFGAPRTVANYWPYLTTYIDYINRAMPFDNPDTLSDEDLYAVVAWILNQNGMIEDDAALDPDSVMEMNELPNHDSFFPCYPDECRPEPELRSDPGTPNPTPGSGE